jgi:hypothetical protein
VFAHIYLFEISKAGAKSAYSSRAEKMRQIRSQQRLGPKDALPDPTSWQHMVLCENWQAFDEAL